MERIFITIRSGSAVRDYLRDRDVHRQLGVSPALQGAICDTIGRVPFVGELSGAQDVSFTEDEAFVVRMVAREILGEDSEETGEMVRRDLAFLLKERPVAKTKNVKRSAAMRASWQRRKLAATNGKTIKVGSVLTAIQLADKLVAECDGNEDVAIALVKRSGGSD